MKVLENASNKETENIGVSATKWNLELIVRRILEVRTALSAGNQQHKKIIGRFSMGHFRVALNLIMKARLSAKFLL